MQPAVMLVLWVIVSLSHVSGAIKECSDWEGKPVPDGKSFRPSKEDPCQTCTCDAGQLSMCSSKSCSAPSCPMFEVVEDECCQHICITPPNHPAEADTNLTVYNGDDPKHIGRSSWDDLALRLVASTVTSLLILVLVLFMVHRLRRRRMFIMMRRLSDEQRDIDDPAPYLTQLDSVDISVSMGVQPPPYEDPPPPYTPSKPPDVLPADAPPPYREQPSDTEYTREREPPATGSLSSIRSSVHSLPDQVFPYIPAGFAENLRRTLQRRSMCLLGSSDVSGTVNSRSCAAGGPDVRSTNGSPCPFYLRSTRLGSNDCATSGEEGAVIKDALPLNVCVNKQAGGCDGIEVTNDSHNPQNMLCNLWDKHNQSLVRPNMPDIVQMGQKAESQCAEQIRSNNNEPFRMSHVQPVITPQRRESVELQEIAKTKDVIDNNTHARESHENVSNWTDNEKDEPAPQGCHTETNFPQGCLLDTNSTQGCQLELHNLGAQDALGASALIHTGQTVSSSGNKTNNIQSGTLERRTMHDIASVLKDNSQRNAVETAEKSNKLREARNHPVSSNECSPDVSPQSPVQRLCRSASMASQFSVCSETGEPRRSRTLHGGVLRNDMQYPVSMSGATVSVSVLEAEAPETENVTVERSGQQLDSSLSGHCNIRGPPCTKGSVHQMNQIEEHVGRQPPVPPGEQLPALSSIGDSVEVNQADPLGLEPERLNPAAPNSGTAQAAGEPDPSGMDVYFGARPKRYRNEKKRGSWHDTQTNTESREESPNRRKHRSVMWDHTPIVKQYGFVDQTDSTLAAFSCSTPEWANQNKGARPKVKTGGESRGGNAGLSRRSSNPKRHSMGILKESFSKNKPNPKRRSVDLTRSRSASNTQEVSESPLGDSKADTGSHSRVDPSEGSDGFYL